MPIVPIKLPPGMMRNGTPYAARGRWVDGNLVRWHDNALRPIGGWEQRLGMVPGTLRAVPTEVVRDVQTYVTNTGNREALFFSNQAAYRMSAGNEVLNVTPVGYPVGISEQLYKTGYGTGPYGVGAYGTPRTLDLLNLTPVSRVVHDMWGENCLFAMRNQSPIYEYVPGDLIATELANAPQNVADLVVTDQRIVMVIRNEPETREVVWSDREDNTEWTSTETNFAGAQRLQGDGLLLGLYKVQNQVLILSETDAHIARYIGAPFVYGFERVGQNCAPIWRDAVQATDRFAVWLGERNFWIYDGTLKPLPCEVMDYIDETLNRDAVSKIHACTISEFSEIWWFYQSKSSTEDVDSYVVFDYANNHWATGKLARTAAVDRGAVRDVMMVNLNGEVFNHEQQNIKVPDAYALSGPLELDNGERNMAVRYVFPDTEKKDAVELYFRTRQMPTEPDYIHGPFQYSNPISTTGVLGREVRMEIRGLTNDWEVGDMRFDVQATGGGFR